MSEDIWNNLHNIYKDKYWISMPSIFAEQAINYFPSSGKLLELGAGLGQDSCYFAAKGYNVTATDIKESALDITKGKANSKGVEVETKKADLRASLPFEDSSFDVIYAHLSLHYFDHKTTLKIFSEIEGILKPDGILAFLTNSINDPEYGTGKKIEDDYFKINNTYKHYFSRETAGDYAKNFSVIMLDEEGETYKDNDMGVHNLVRFVGRKRD